jgi:V/A-type H+-transporting ATPase subunit C
MESRPYRGVLKGLEGVRLRRGLLEEKLPYSLYYDYERIRPFLYDKKTRDYLGALFLRFELNILKILLCMVFGERSIPYSPPELDILFARRTKADPARLVAAKTVQALIEELRGTELYSLLSDSYTRQSSASLFELERQLDLYYYMQLWRKQEKWLDKLNHAVMERIIGTEIDLLNILWIYRLKHFYKMQDARIYAYLIPINYRLTPETLNRLAECGDFGAFAELVSAGPYGQVFIKQDGTPPFTQPEAALSGEMRKVCAAEAKHRPDTLAVTVGYIYDKEREINNITTALEGVRYGLPPRQIMDYLY